MWSIFKKKEKLPLEPVPEDFSFLGCDFHSHLVPGIDDGAQTPEDSLALIRSLKAAGFSKLITTPHVHGDFYPNTNNVIRKNFEQLKKVVAANGIDMQLEVAAEYFLDNYFMEEVLPNGLLTFNGNYVLVEIPMMGWPPNLNEMIFAIQSAGYRPVMAHPERYLYVKDIARLQELKERDVLMQLNMLSLTGYYGRQEQVLGEHYMKERLYDFCATDTHHERHARKVGELIATWPKIARELKSYGFLNISLLNK